MELRVTRDFGQVPLRGAKKPVVRESDTVMRFLQSRAKVETRYGGRFVQAIDGVAGTAADEKRDWFYFVNGIEAPTGAADRKLEPGDVVQWDYRRWDAAQRVPAIVGRIGAIAQTRAWPRRLIISEFLTMGSASV